MSLVKFRRRPFGNPVAQDLFDLDNIFGDRFWNNSFMDNPFWNGKSMEPALNVKETDDNYEIELAAPGFAKNDFEVTIEDGHLNISAEKEHREEEKVEKFTRREFSYSSFQRSLQLPDNIKDGDIKAKYHDGILSFRLAKKKETKKLPPQKVQID